MFYQDEHGNIYAVITTNTTASLAYAMPEIPAIDQPDDEFLRSCGIVPEALG